MAEETINELDNNLRISPDLTEFISKHYVELENTQKDTLLPSEIDKIQARISGKPSGGPHSFTTSPQSRQFSRIKTDYVASNIEITEKSFSDIDDAPEYYKKPLYIKIATVILPDNITAPVKIGFKNKHLTESSYSITIFGYNGSNNQTLTIDQGLAFETKKSFELVLIIPALWKTSSYRAPSETFYFGKFVKVLDGPRSFTVQKLENLPDLPTTHYEFDLKDSTDGLKFTKSIDLKSGFEFKYSAELQIGKIEKAFSTEASIKFEDTVSFSIEADLDGGKKYKHYTNEISRIIYLAEDK